MARVLIVDDNIQIRKLIAGSLAQLGFDNITEAANGRLALDFCLQNMPDIITLDWNMPEMNGLDFLRTLRKVPAGDKPKVIFCSTEGRPASISKVMDSGADDYIVKPVDLNKLRDSIKLLNLI